MNIDLDIPDIPSDIFNAALDDADLTYALRCKELWEEVLEEFFNEDFELRAHHNTGTYDQGCRGPLCRKALREHPRRKKPDTGTLQMREERIYDPVIEYFHVVIKHRARISQQAVLKEQTA